MAAAKSGDKGLALEELLKAYFWLAGYFAVRGVPYKLDDDEITDIDLWLYERPGASTRRRIVVDIKSRRSPKAAERVVWTKGLQSALSVDSGIVATTDKRASTRRLAKSLNIILLDGDAIGKLAQSEQLRNTGQMQFEEIESAVKAVDGARRSNDWRTVFQDARAALATGLGVRSANKNLQANAFFAEQAVFAQPDSPRAELATRLIYFTSSLAAVSLDFLLADHAFRTNEERRQVVVEGLRFGQSDAMPAVATVRTAVGLARQYAENGDLIAKQIEHGFYADADRIPAEIIADHVAKLAGNDSLFNVARELERTTFSRDLPPFDQLTIDAKSFLGVVLDFNGITRQKVALAWTKKGNSKPERESASSRQSEGPGPLFKPPAQQ